METRSNLISLKMICMKPSLWCCLLAHSFLQVREQQQRWFFADPIYQLQQCAGEDEVPCLLVRQLYTHATVRAFFTRSATCTFAVLACLYVTTRLRNSLKRTTCVRLTAPHWRGLVIWPWRTRQRPFSLSSLDINTAIHFTSFAIELKSLSVREPSKDDWD